jgi:hypothetical protein
VKNRYRSGSMLCCFLLHLYDLIQQAKLSRVTLHLVLFQFLCFRSVKQQVEGRRGLDGVLCVHEKVSRKGRTRGVEATFYRPDYFLLHISLLVTRTERAEERNERAEQVAQLISQRSENIYNFVGTTHRVGRARPG